MVDMARKVVGVGSVGTRCWIALMLGRDESDPLFLQIKEAEASVLEQYVGKSAYKNHGQRVVEGQRFMQSASDIFLGWDRIKHPDGNEHDFYVRQMWDGKFSPQVDIMEPEVLARLRARCAARRSPGPTPARATGSRSRATSAPATPSTGRSRTFADELRRPEPARLRRGGRRREEWRPRRARGDPELIVEVTGEV